MIYTCKALLQCEFFYEFVDFHFYYTTCHKFCGGLASLQYATSHGLLDLLVYESTCHRLCTGKAFH